MVAIQRTMLWLYRLISLPVLAGIAPLFLWRTRGRGGHVGASSQRLGALPALPPRQPRRRRIWLQAVSVGELLAVGPVIEALLARGDVELVLTTTTSTSQQLAQKNYAGRALAVAYFPVDLWPFAARAWRRIEPDLAILTEGERWPEHIAQARRRGVPVIAINARISARSFRRMRPLRAIVPGMLAGMTRLLAVSAQDAARFHALGFEPQQIETTGNLKVDVVIPELDPAARDAWRTELGFGRDDLVLLGASTWPGEEAALLRAWHQARGAMPAGKTLRLLLVPRHAERRHEVETLVASAGVRHRLRTRGETGGEVDVCIADTTGELPQLTQLADIVFVGRSLPPHRDGQTPVETAGLGRALLFGPGMSSFRTIADALVECGAVLRVANEADLIAAVGRLVADPDRRLALGAAGRAWHLANRGALARTLQVIGDLLTTSEARPRRGPDTQVPRAEAAGPPASRADDSSRTSSSAQAPLAS